MDNSWAFAKINDNNRDLSQTSIMDDLASQSLCDGDNDEIRAILADVCQLTDMGFAAVARVTEARWIACQVVDKVEFGLTPGGELEIAKTICNEIRDHGQAVVFDSAIADEQWCSHPVPMIYGFQSYASFPIFLEDGEFYGTLCAIDPAERHIEQTSVVCALRDCASRVAAILSQQHRASAGASRNV